MNTSQTKLKKKRNVVIFRGLAIFFLVIQLLGYIGNSGSGEGEARDTAGTIAYQTGYNFPLWLAMMFFILSLRAEKKIKKDADQSQMDSIKRP